MSSITKQQLKSVVKECLLEILSEGVGSSLNESLKRKDDNSSVHRRSPALDRTVVSSQKRTITNSLKETIRAEAGGNLVLAEILSDTAKTTLPSMLESEDRRGNYIPPTGNIERKVAMSTPDQLFGEEVSSKWADLAFADFSKK